MGPLEFRLGSSPAIETVRITWPNGLIQNELGQVPNRIANLNEALGERFRHVIGSAAARDKKTADAIMDDRLLKAAAPPCTT